MAWWNGPDPYTYERIGIDPITGRPVYVVSIDGIELGVIKPVRASTDTKIAGTRLRRSGRGADEFIAANSRSGISWNTRRTAAETLDPAHRGHKMARSEIATHRRRYQSPGIEPPPTKEHAS